MYHMFTLVEYFPKRKNGQSSTPFVKKEFKMAIEEELLPGLWLKVLGTESTIKEMPEMNVLLDLKVWNENK